MRNIQSVPIIQMMNYPFILKASFPAPVKCCETERNELATFIKCAIKSSHWRRRDVFVWCLKTSIIPPLAAPSFPASRKPLSPVVLFLPSSPSSRYAINQKQFAAAGVDVVREGDHEKMGECLLGGELPLETNSGLSTLFDSFRRGWALWQHFTYRKRTERFGMG